MGVHADDFAQLQLQFVDQIQWRYEVIRPVVLFADRTARQRAHETHTHPTTVRRLTRGFRQRGMLGLLPDDVEVVIRGRPKRISEAVRQEIDRLKALYDGFHYRELARILFIKFGEPIDHKTVKTMWHESPVSLQGRLDLLDYHAYPDRSQARLQVIQLYYQGWAKGSISRFLKVSRPTVNAWIRRFEAEHFAGLMDKSRAPNAPARKIWLPLMVQVYHLQKAHPDAGEFRIWSLLAPPDVSVRTIGRVMALNRLVYDDIPHGPKRGVKPVPLGGVKRSCDGDGHDDLPLFLRFLVAAPARLWPLRFGQHWPFLPARLRHVTPPPDPAARPRLAPAPAPGP
jgi:transposase